MEELRRSCAPEITEENEQQSDYLRVPQSYLGKILLSSPCIVTFWEPDAVTSTDKPASPLDSRSPKPGTEELRRKHRIITTQAPGLTAEKLEKDPVAERKEGKPATDSRGVGGARVEPRNPLALLPKEMWASLFEYLDDDKDLASCSATCHLLRNLVRDSRKWHFMLCCPLLDKYLTFSDKLKCRKVCRAWLKGVEKIITVTKRFYLPFTGQEDPQLVRLEEMQPADSISLLPLHRVYMGACVANPATLRVQQEPNLESVDVLLEEQLMQHSPQVFLEDATDFFRRFGTHIKHLTLHVNEGLLRTLHLWDVVLSSLSKCTGLKNLRVLASSRLPEDVLVTLSEQDIIRITPADFSVPSNLESVNIVGFLGSAQLEECIFQRYSVQIKSLEVFNWTYQIQLLGRQVWNSLREITAWDKEEFGPRFLERLVFINAPELDKLTVNALDARGSLVDLLKLTHHFPKLSTLCLDNCCEFADIGAMPDGLVVATSIKTLELKDPLFVRKNRFRYSFLIHFPSVETFKLSAWGEFLDQLPLEEAFLELNPAWLQKKYIYWSNLWEVLPNLQKIALTVIEQPRIRRDYLVTYTRKEYDAFQADGQTD